MKKRIAILGSTGSIGTQALEVIENEIKGNEYVDKLVEFVKTSKRGCTLRDKAAYHGAIEE